MTAVCLKKWKKKHLHVCNEHIIRENAKLREKEREAIKKIIIFQIGETVPLDHSGRKFLFSQQEESHQTVLLCEIC